MTDWWTTARSSVSPASTGLGGISGDGGSTPPDRTPPVGYGARPSGRRWPTTSDYMHAMQRHRSVLRDRQLVDATVVVGLFDLPAVATGQSAAVFRLDADGSWAVRCMTQDGVGREKAYVDLRDRLTVSECPYFVGAEWQADGITVNGHDWPIVKMEWIEGATLDTWIADRLRRFDELQRIADRIDEMLAGLWATGIAHGDLQHGNIIVRPTGQLALVDYDGTIVFEPGSPEAWIGTGGDVAGHPNYQHPHRVESNRCSPWMDAFSGLVITTSIRSLASRPDLWDRFHNEENLILSATDLQRPGETPIWSELRSIGPVRDRVELLEQFCRRDSDLRATYAEIVDGKVPVGSGPWRARPVETNAAIPVIALTNWDDPGATGSESSEVATGSPPRSVVISTGNGSGRSPRRAFIWAVGVVALALLVTIAAIAVSCSRRPTTTGASRQVSSLGMAIEGLGGSDLAPPER